jgi:hypothetical protein
MMTRLKRYFDIAFFLIWLALGIACLFAIIQLIETETSLLFDYGTLIATGLAVVATLTGVAFIKAWPFSSVLNRISGVGIILYSLSVITLGVEDVGGPLITMPFGLAGIAFGVWSILIKKKGIATTTCTGSQTGYK